MLGGLANRLRRGKNLFWSIKLEQKFVSRQQRFPEYTIIHLCGIPGTAQSLHSL